MKKEQTVGRYADTELLAYLKNHKREVEERLKNSSGKWQIAWTHELEAIRACMSLLTGERV